MWLNCEWNCNLHTNLIINLYYLWAKLQLDFLVKHKLWLSLRDMFLNFQKIW
jgi:hypothetical protein